MLNMCAAEKTKRHFWEIIQLLYGGIERKPVIRGKVFMHVNATRLH
jgi:hypothetical protein